MLQLAASSASSSELMQLAAQMSCPSEAAEAAEVSHWRRCTAGEADSATALAALERQKVFVICCLPGELHLPSLGVTLSPTLRKKANGIGSLTP